MTKVAQKQGAGALYKVRIDGWFLWWDKIGNLSPLCCKSRELGAVGVFHLPGLINERALVIPADVLHELHRVAP